MELPIIPELEDFLAWAYAGADDAHDKKHAIRVHANFCEIVEREGIVLTEREARIAPYVTTLHDVLDHKRPEAKRPPEWFVRQWLFSMLEDHDTVCEIMHIHRNCSWSKRDTSLPYRSDGSGDTLRLLLQDADWLEAVGDVGLERCVAYTKSVGGRVPEDVCQHIKDKLLLIPERLNYQSSREMGRERLAPLQAYLVSVDI
ncbi:putative HD hydrolase [Acanthamoeba castellanii medusavirus]|uniref:HD hydrolase n=1 Tax=Acanthamoeba castellanii medusavirus J1 TaxID=3114988 RepID=A0A3T1CWE1_9VIRU|nr:putative HD hydrolase [Acanthamoeba castellanii medusavirus]BBI30142.1 putative HD hydrolase [Acanthamoeba castellanii medusavirus J1]